MIDYLSARIRSFGYAIKGIMTLIGTQPHARLHLLATVVVTGAGVYLHLRRWEWVAILLCIGMVWMAEALNTAIEFLADEVTLERRDRIGKAKDVAAGGVLIVAIISVAVAALVFLNHFGFHLR
ncbi:MAG: diacylglycerol kinase family protein [Proteobacteria bacterium]|jgi:diacylglycerol kinase (ATP)|nr:diacylglycerol kinase family protein [Pseudomonadota bacterium]